MKTKQSFLLLLPLMLIFSLQIQAGPLKTNQQANTYETIEQNRLIGLQSDNQGLRVSCAFNLGEMKSKKAVIPLIELLRDGETYEEQVIAALSLVKIGDPQGIYMIERCGEFHRNEKTQEICKKFYNAIIFGKYPGTETENLNETFSPQEDVQ
jgi:PBS lyase HEAT-like repeat